MDSNFNFSSDRFGVSLDPETATPEEIGKWLADLGILNGAIRPDQQNQAAKDLAKLSADFVTAISEARARYEKEGGDLDQMLEEVAHRVIGGLKGLSAERIQAQWKKG
jgi:hypothetical protein